MYYYPPTPLPSHSQSTISKQLPRRRPSFAPLVLPPSSIRRASSPPQPPRNPARSPRGRRLVLLPTAPIVVLALNGLELSLAPALPEPVGRRPRRARGRQGPTQSALDVALQHLLVLEPARFVVQRGQEQAQALALRRQEGLFLRGAGEALREERATATHFLHGGDVARGAAAGAARARLTERCG